MAESRPWWKLWVSALSDDDLEALSLEDWARWARLGAHVKLHGEHGAMVSRTPHGGLSKVLRTSPHGGPRGSAVYAADRLVNILRRLPGVMVEEITGDQPGIRITFRNWKKYQEDSSAERTREYRRRQKTRDAASPSPTTPFSDGAPPSPRDGVEEKRSRRESPLPPLSPSPDRRFDWPSPAVKAASLRPGASRWSPGRWPYDAFRHDCPERDWRGRCVTLAWVEAHPDDFPVLASGAPKQCAAHQVQTSAP